MKICFIGTGNLAGSLIGGLLKSKIVKKENITGSDISRKQLQSVKKKYKIKISKNNIEAVKLSDIIILSVKPKDMENVLKEISSKLVKKQLVISVCAGITTKFIEKFLKKIPVIKVMPNIPVSVNEGITAICKGKYSNNKHLRIAKKIFSSVGEVIIKAEKFFDLITAISGSGPAYVFYFVQQLISFANRYGLNFNDAKILVSQTFFGASKMLKCLNENPEGLRIKVTSPGGTTQAAIEYFEKNKLLKIFEEGVKKALLRSKQLTR